jgi:hypothetical protein
MTYVACLAMCGSVETALESATVERDSFRRLKEFRREKVAHRDAENAEAKRIEI